mmetsp:Transcript_2828/g.6303  ORF Transcript_2828/g.6303 Transcript_2828/m.6303 type:complete len:545 (+) Transcript_2828:139-1773(+)
MGGVCCRSGHYVEEDQSLDVSRHVVGSSSMIALAKKNKEQNRIPGRVDFNRDNNHAGDDDETEFFDAFQSFKDFPHDEDGSGGKGYTYPPAKQMPTMGTSICIDTPQTLLHSSHTSRNPQQAQSEEALDVGSSINSVQLEMHLSNSTVGVTTHGYPGQLNEDELKVCLRFRKELNSRDPTFKEIVRAYAPAEPEAFALCRFLRSRNFDIDAVFSMLEEGDALKVWQEAKANKFYQDFEKEYGCPVSVFMALYPVVVSGLAKNGATLFYFKPGNMDMNGLECVCNVADLLPMMWDLMHKKGADAMLREAKRHDPETTTVLAERIIIMDLKGIPSSLFDKGFFSICGNAVSCFPETMNRTYMVNVPMSFQVVWSVAKLFMEERTLRKIGFFSNVNKAAKDLLNFVDADELLSTYGGNANSFEDVTSARQAEYSDEKENSRFITETLTVTRYDAKVFVHLKVNEKVSSIKIYSKGDNGAEFRVISDSDGSVLVEPTMVRREEGNDKKHYSAELDSSKIPSGSDGKFTVVANGSAKEFYLVTIHICDC